jgi:ribulose-phosphate 3-epimerase
MATICPTVTAYEPHAYRTQMEHIEPFAERVHIDLMDGEFAPHKSVGLDQVWWPEHMTADIHLMYQRPRDSLDHLVKLKPNLVVLHYEAQGIGEDMALHLRNSGIKTGLALLPATTVDQTAAILPYFDHVLIFSGNLGEHGGFADLRLLEKVSQIRNKFPNLEISWDGGINDQNATQLIEAGVQVLNTGGFIQNASDPAAAYSALKNLI